MGFFDKLKKYVDMELWKRKREKEGRTTSEDLEIPLTFKVGSVGEIFGEEFEDIAHVRYEWGGGMWDECLLKFKDSKKWLLIDEPNYILYDSEILIGEKVINLGINFINNKKIFIDSSKKATVTNVYGYGEIKEGTDVKVYDGKDEDGNLISIREYLGKYESNVVLRKGRQISRFDIELYG